MSSGVTAATENAEAVGFALDSSEDFTSVLSESIAADGDVNEESVGLDPDISPVAAGVKLVACPLVDAELCGSIEAVGVETELSDIGLAPVCISGLSVDSSDGGTSAGVSGLSVDVGDGGNSVVLVVPVVYGV